MFYLSKGQRQQPPNSAASVGGAPASSAVAAASAETSAAEPATGGTVPSAASIKAFPSKKNLRDTLDTGNYRVRNISIKSCPPLFFIGFYLLLLLIFSGEIDTSLVRVGRPKTTHHTP